MLRLARSNAEVRVVADQVGCPTSATDIAIALQTMVLRMIEDSSAPHGIYHFVNAGKTSWCGLAQEIFTVSEEAGGPSAAVTAITSAEYPTAARRPANSRLRTEKLQRDYRIRRSEEHTSELQSPIRRSTAVFCLTKKKQNTDHNH